MSVVVLTFVSCDCRMRAMMMTRVMTSFLGGRAVLMAQVCGMCWEGRGECVGGGSRVGVWKSRDWKIIYEVCEVMWHRTN